MQRRKYLAVVLAACLVLSGCAGRETASVSSNGGEQETTGGLSSSQLQTQEQTPSQGQQQSQQPQEQDVSAGASSTAQDEKWAEAEEASAEVSSDVPQEREGIEQSSAEQTSASSEAKASNAERASGLSEEVLEKMRTYAKSFAEFYNTPFASPDDLDYGEIGRNSLFLLIVDLGEDYFEVNASGYLYIPKELLQSYVWEHFGIENYRYPVSENPNFLPQYNEEKDAYLFAAARGGLNAAVSVVEERITDKIAAYIIRFEYPDIETGEIMEVVEMRYIFQIVPVREDYSLQVCSASVL